MKCKCGNEMVDLGKYWGKGNHDYHVCKECQTRLFDGQWIMPQFWQDWSNHPPKFTHEYGGVKCID